jgi:hypothetical protein
MKPPVKINQVPQPLSIFKINVQEIGSQDYSSHLLLFMWQDEISYAGGKASEFRRTAFAQVPAGKDLNWRIGRKPGLLERDLFFPGPCATVTGPMAKVLVTLWTQRYDRAELPED